MRLSANTLHSDAFFHWVVDELTGTKGEGGGELFADLLANQISSFVVEMCI